jgi:capsular exopolysaccharide synthesis family protein
MLDNTIKTPADVEDKLKATMLGLLPLIKSEVKSESKGAYTGFIDDKTTGFSEAIRTIRTGVLLSDIDREQHIMVVTSSIPNEGKSTVATNLAAALGQMHKTLIIDADMRRPTLAKTFGISGKQAGLSEIVSGSSDIESCITTSSDGTFDILCAGVIPPNPLELLSSEKFKSLINELSQRYHNIIIDSPPTQSVSDSLVLSALATGVIYVVKADSTSHTLATQGLARISSTGANTLGVILNQVNLENASYYDYDYLTGYYDVYGYSGKHENS